MAERQSPARRALRLAAMTAGVTGSYVGYLAQSAFLGQEQRRRKLGAAHTRAARRMTDEMSVLRGPAMKLGQALSLQADVLPEEMIAELSKLQMQAPGMHPSLVRAQFRASMGRDPEDVYATFDPEPFAAASLGQVHHATTRRGDALAVKIQYPGIRDAIANDFRWFRTVSAPAQFSKYIPRAIIDELEEQIGAETDYVREADNIEHFAEGLRPLPWVSVPRVHRGLSTDRVLTMSLLTGQHLDAFLARRPSQKLRDLVGARLFELFYFQVFRLEVFHNDPHWGNYLLEPDGAVRMLDFGGVKRLTPAFVQNLREVFFYQGSRTSPEFHRLMEERYVVHGQRLSPAALRALARFVTEFVAMVYPRDPAHDGTPFDFSDGAFLREYMTQSMNLTRAKVALPEYVMLARAETGLYQTLHRLRARVHTSAIVRRLIMAG